MNIALIRLNKEKPVTTVAEVFLISVFDLKKKCSRETVKFKTLMQYLLLIFTLKT